MPSATSNVASQRRARELALAHLALVARRAVSARLRSARQRGQRRSGSMEGRIAVRQYPFLPLHGPLDASYRHDVNPIAAPPTVRLAEVLAAVSLAADVGHDQPLEKSLRNAVIAARLSDELELSRAERSAAYYVALLRSMGCTANSHETAVLMGGDDRAFLGLVQELAGGDPLEWARGAAAHVAATAPELARRAHRRVVPVRRTARGPQRRRLGVRGLDDARAPARPVGGGPGGARPGLRALGRARAGIRRRRGAVRVGPRSRTSSTSSRSPTAPAACRPRASSSAGARAATSTRASRRSSTAARTSCSPTSTTSTCSRAALDAEPTPQPRCPRGGARGPRPRDRRLRRPQVAVDARPLARGRRARRAPRRATRRIARRSCSRACCTTSAASRCRTASGTSRSRSAPRSGSGCGCTRTTRSASSRARRSSRASRRSRAPITSASTARATTAASATTR